MCIRFLLCAGAMVLIPNLAALPRPNILWIISEDASPHIGPYGERLIATPNLSRLAREGVMFEHAFVTAPVCSPSRSALIAGMYQTTFGSHNHQSCNADPITGGSGSFYDSYHVPAGIRLIPELFAAAGYYVTNAGYGGHKDKTDYNFVPRGTVYHGTDWAGRAKGQPFFAQIQLAGGKARRAKVDTPVDPAAVPLPPYYADHPVLRKDWADYLNTWIKTDREVGELMARLAAENLLDSTLVFFFTDHGVAHLRGKQFLYDEGIRIPLLVRLANAKAAGTIRRDLVSHIDIAAASLDLAEIPLPRYLQGRPLFSARHEPREAVFSARDRCDETVDLLRSVRTERFKYIRNFMSYVALAQPSSYKDGKEIMRVTRQLHAAGRLDAVQARIFAAPRPVEELYDVVSDPHELVNLAERPEHQAVRAELQKRLYAWMVESADMGVIAEPILEEMGLRAGSKHPTHAHRAESTRVSPSFRWLAALSGLLIAPALQAGDILGQVSDVNGLFLAGATVQIAEIDRSAVTDREGRFRINNVSPGTYTLSVRSIGYQDAVKSIVVPSAGPISASLVLSGEVVTLGEFVVEGYREGRARAIQQKKTMNNILDIISADAIGNLPDRNVAEAVSRLPGVNLAPLDGANDQPQGGEGRCVSIRGVDPNLNQVLIDGNTMAAPGGTRLGRAVPLDVLGASQIAQIEVIKSTTPDLDGNSLGGTVNVKTASAFDRRERFVQGSVAMTTTRRAARRASRPMPAPAALLAPAVNGG